MRAALAAFTGTPAEHLMVGSGADELIDLLLRVILDPGDRVLICPPAFSMYALNTWVHSGIALEVLLREDFGLDIPAIRRAVAREKPKVLFLTSPNNPDGSLIPPAELEELLQLPVLIVLDEAYIEFPENGGRLGENLSWIHEVPTRENLVVFRTFSKWAGLAGLRIGYGAFPGWLLPALWKAKPPYNVNVAANAAALASLGDLDFLAENVKRIRAERQRLAAALAQIPSLRPYPSQANFILCKVLGHSAAELKGRLAEEGILIRYFDSRYLPDYVRISVGRPQDSDRLLDALKRIL